MQELVGRLTALDPEASETLKIVTYFDALVSGGAGPDALLRGAAALSGAIAGSERMGRVSRRSPDGLVPDAELPRVAERAYARGSVWLEREGSAQANDEMVIERLLLAEEVIEARRNPPTELEIVIDPTRSLDDRSVALIKLHLTPSSRIRIAVSRYEQTASNPSVAIVPTPYGMLRATLVRQGAADPSAPCGLGVWVRADEAPESWESAVTALRVSDPSHPIVDAESLGALLLLARVHTSGAAPHPDVTRLAALDKRSSEVLRVLAEADSIRSAATILGMHHSTIQARHESLVHDLGYDPRTTLGKVRYAVAEFLVRLTQRA